MKTPTFVDIKDWERLKRKTDFNVNPGHWMWTGAVSTKGYGAAWLNGGVATAQRQFYRMFHGEIPAGLLVRHKCDIRLCVNPDCLELGTEKENSGDMVIRGRSPHGERNGRTNLTEADIRDVFELSSAGVEQAVIAERFGIRQGTVSRILNGKRWTYY